MTHNVAGPLEISDTKVNAEEVDVRVVEDVARKRYRILLKFPAGFSMPEDGSLKLTFKTDDPTAPTVEVPIIKAASRLPRKPQQLRQAQGSNKP